MFATYYCAHCDGYKATRCQPWDHFHMPNADGDCAVCGISDN